MLRLLTSGGLGDAVMSFAKEKALEKELKCTPDDIHIYHVRIREDNLDKSILDFYKSQGIDSTIIKIEKIDDRHPGYILDEWSLNNVKDYDYYLGTHWSSDNGSDIPSWEIESFPKIKYSNIDNVEILLSPSSGGTESAKKEFTFNEVKSFIDEYPDTILIGRGEDIRYEEFPNSLYNNTSIQKVVDLIASSDTVISPEGFVAYFAGMCGKKVFVKNDNTKAIYNRKHPDWNMNLVNGIGDIL